MALKLQEMKFEDFDTMINHADLYAPGDDLVGPPTPVCWPVSTSSDARRRLEFHMTKQKDRFLGDNSARYLKIIDNKSGEIISMARWHWYPSGYSYASVIPWETHNPVEGKLFPVGMNIELHNYILTSRDAYRQYWQEVGKPCWILTHLVTRTSQRGRGAAKLLIEWGVEQASQVGAPAYLEAATTAAPIYAKHGFRQVGDVGVLDLRPHGVDMEFEFVRMRFRPEDEMEAGLGSGEKREGVTFPGM